MVRVLDALVQTVVVVPVTKVAVVVAVAVDLAVDVLLVVLKVGVELVLVRVLALFFRRRRTLDVEGDGVDVARDEPLQLPRDAVDPGRLDTGEEAVVPLVAHDACGRVVAAEDEIVDVVGPAAVARVVFKPCVAVGDVLVVVVLDVSAVVRVATMVMGVRVVVVDVVVVVLDVLVLDVVLVVHSPLCSFCFCVFTAVVAARGGKRAAVSSGVSAVSGGRAQRRRPLHAPEKRRKHAHQGTLDALCLPRPTPP